MYDRFCRCMVHGAVAVCQAEAASRSRRCVARGGTERVSRHTSSTSFIKPYDFILTGAVVRLSVGTRTHPPRRHCDKAHPI